MKLKRPHRYSRRSADDPNQGQLAWTLFVGVVVALCALLQVTVPRNLNRPASPMVLTHPADQQQPYSDPADRQPASASQSDFN